MSVNRLRTASQSKSVSRSRTEYKSLNFSFFRRMMLEMFKFWLTFFWLMKPSRFYKLSSSEAEVTLILSAHCFSSSARIGFFGI